MKYKNNILHIPSADFVTKLPALELQTTFRFPAFKFLGQDMYKFLLEGTDSKILIAQYSIHLNWD